MDAAERDRAQLDPPHQLPLPPETKVEIARGFSGQEQSNKKRVEAYCLKS